MIFIDCKSRGLDVFYAPIQVAYNLNDQKTFDRAVRALQAAMDELNIEGI